MDPPLSLERFAALSAELEAGAPHEDVLAREDVSAETWAQVQEVWLRRMAEEVSRGRFELTSRYNEAFTARRQELATPGGAEEPFPEPIEALEEEPYAEGAPDEGSHGAAFVEEGDPEVTLPAPRRLHREPQTTLPDIEPPGVDAQPPLRDLSVTQPDFTPQPEDELIPDRVTPTQEYDPTRLSQPPETPRVPTLQQGSPRLVPATPFVAVQQPSEAIEDEMTPVPATADPAPVQGLEAQRYAPSPSDAYGDMELELEEDADEEPITPAPPASMAQDGSRFDGLPFRPAPLSAPPDTPRAPPSVMPDVLPFRPAGAAGSSATTTMDSTVASIGLPFRKSPADPPTDGGMSGSSVFEGTTAVMPVFESTTAVMPSPAPAAMAAPMPAPMAAPMPAPMAAPMPAPAPMAAAMQAPSPLPMPAPSPSPSSPGLPAPPPGAFPFASSAQVRQDGPARSASGAFPFAPPPAAARSAAPPAAMAPAPLMMPASLGSSTCILTIEQFASLSAEIAISPGAAAQCRARYGLDETTHMAESGLWHRRFSQDKELFTRYSALYQSYREWLQKTLR